MVTPSLFVPDASVILKWVLNTPEEENADKALDLLNLWVAGSCEFLLPKLWLFECGNVLGLKAPDVAAEIVNVLLGYQFRECEIDDALAAVTLRLMKECRVTFFDAVYHAVALEHRGTLVTADAAYCRKAQAKGNIIMLDELLIAA